MKTRQPILVTGASGFIGANMVHRLVRQKKDVHIFVRRGSNLWRIQEILPLITTHWVDISDETSTMRSIKKIQPRIIYHFAAHGFYLLKQSEIENMVRANIWGTVNILNAARLLPNLYMLVSAGSSFEYGSKKSAISETEILEPINAYGVSKAAQTLWCLYFAQFYKLPLIILRPSLTFGPYEDARRLVPDAILAHLKDEPLALSTPHSRNDFLYIEDLLCAFEIAASSPHLAGQAFNIASGEEHTVKQVVNSVRRLTHAKAPLHWGMLARCPWDSAKALYNIDKSKEILGWSPQYRLKTGLEQTIEWFRYHLDLYKNSTRRKIISICRKQY